MVVPSSVGACEGPHRMWNERPKIDGFLGQSPVRANSWSSRARHRSYASLYAVA